MAATPKFMISSLVHHLKKLPQLTTVRCSSYLSSHPVRDLNEYPEVEVINNPPEWKFVDRLLPPATIPKPIPKPEYPSGWKPPEVEKIKNLSFFVARTKSYMVPVYLETTFRGQRRITVVRLIQGNIWALEKELRTVVERARGGKLCASRVNEMSGQIRFHGDYVDEVREYLKERGF